MPSCSPPSRVSTRISGQAIHPNCSRGSRAFRRRARRCGTAAAAAARRAWRSPNTLRWSTPPTSRPSRSPRRGRIRACGTRWRRPNTAGLPTQSVDLVTVAQALHWFDVRPSTRRPRAWRDRARCSRSGTIRARSSSDAELDRRFLAFYSRRGRAVLAAGAPARRGWLPTLPFPSRKSPTPEFGARARLDLRAGAGLREQLVGHRALSPGAGADPRAAAARSLARRVAGRRRQRRRCACPLACGSARCARADVVRSAPSRRRALRAVPCRWRPCACARTRRRPGPARPCSRRWRR